MPGIDMFFKNIVLLLPKCVITIASWTFFRLLTLLN